MTATDQLDLLSAIADNPHPVADRDRDRILAAIILDAATHDDEVSPNRVRALLTGDHGLDVPPRMLSATYSALNRRGLLRHSGWSTNDDVKGRNAGKPQRLWLWVGAA